MNNVVLRLVALPIYVSREDAARCSEPSSASDLDGCPCFNRDDDGDSYCGAFGVYLKTTDGEEDHDGQALYLRAGACVAAEKLP